MQDETAQYEKELSANESSFSYVSEYLKEMKEAETEGKETPLNSKFSCRCTYTRADTHIHASHTFCP